MTHPLARRRGNPRNIGHHRLCHVRADVLGRFLLRRASDLTDHDDGFRAIVRLEQFEDVDEAAGRDRIAANADTGGLAETHVGGLFDRLVGQRAGA